MTRTERVLILVIGIGWALVLIFGWALYAGDPAHPERRYS